MRRREFLNNTAAMGIVMAAASVPDLVGSGIGGAGTLISGASTDNKLKPPAKGSIPVAFTISQHVTVIDFSGPWEVFQDVSVPGRDEDIFDLFTVSDKTETLTASGGLKIVPDYTFETSPQPKIVVVPAQMGSSALPAWLRKVTPATDVTMSVCAGVFQLARAGLLSGKSATTHHDFLDRLAKEFPDIDVKRGLRFVEGEKISTAGGLTSGFDLALRVVERYFGREIAQNTATYMEYQSKGWIV